MAKKKPKPKAKAKAKPKAKPKKPAAKAKRVVYHVTWDKKLKIWLIKKEGRKTPVSKHTTKREAVAEGRKLAKKEKLGQLIIHKQDGKIETEYTYGKDPVKYKG